MTARTTAPTGAPTGATRERLQKVQDAAVSEVRRYLVMFVYLYVLFGLFALNSDLLLREHSIPLLPHGWALVNALVLAKVMLIAEDMKLGERLRPRPLIFPIVLDAAILAVLFIVAHVLEHMISGVIGGESVRASVPVVGGGGFTGLAVVALILFFALLPFFTCRYMTREIGWPRVKSLMFGTPEPRAGE